MDETAISFADFRKEFNIPAADLRAICKELKLDVIRDGTEHYIVGTNPYSVSNHYYLKHAIFEYRATMYVNKTKAGEFLEYEVDLPEGGVGYVGVHSFDSDAVKPKTPALKKTPNKQPKTMLVPVGNKGTDLMLRQQSAPPVMGGDAFQLLVEALKQAQQPAPPPEPLHAQKTLLEAEQQGFLITSEQLGQVLGMSKGTITSKKSGFRKLGFVFEKVKEGTTTLWKVKRY